MTKEQAIKLLSKDTSGFEIHILEVELKDYDKVTDKIQEAMDMGIEAIKNQTWISVKDRLPEEEGQYIVTTKFGIKISSFSNNLYKIDKYDFEDYKGKQRKGFYNYDSEYGYFEQDVLAWMPTPEPYKEGEADE